MIISAVGATSLVMLEEGDGFWSGVNMVIGFDIIYFVISYLVFDYVVEE